MMMTNFNFANQTVLITGGSSGIGLSVAEAFCRTGCSVAITGRRPDKLKEAKEYLQSRFPECHVLTVCSDASEVSEIRKMVDKVERHFGQIDILVNNAGTNVLNMALDVTEEEWDKVMNLNLKGLFFCSQSVGRGMVRRRKGKIIHMASQMGLVGLQQRAAYCASKGGVVQLTKVLAIEWAPFNVQVNAVAPTFVETPLTKPMLDNKQFYDEVIRRIPMKEIPKTDDIVGAVLFLASDSSRFVTGHTLPVDGGWVAW